MYHQSFARCRKRSIRTRLQTIGRTYLKPSARHGGGGGAKAEDHHRPEDTSMTMKAAHTTQGLITLLLTVPTASGRAAAQQADQRRGPLPPGSTIEAHDGDTVVIDDDARVRVIRRRHARVRVVYNAAQRWLILLARYQPRNGIATDGVDAFTFLEVEGDRKSVV